MRKTALKILTDTERGAYLNLAFKDAVLSSPLSSGDIAFLKELENRKKIIEEFGDVVKFENLWDGYKITFPNGADIVQHSGSYQSKLGCVEPAGMPCAFRPITIEKAKKIITKNQKNLFETS